MYSLLLYCDCVCRGHGTYLHEDNLVASVAGVVERVNRLLCVRPMKSRLD